MNFKKETNIIKITPYYENREGVKQTIDTIDCYLLIASYESQNVVHTNALCLIFDFTITLNPILLYKELSLGSYELMSCRSELSLLHKEFMDMVVTNHIKLHHRYSPAYANNKYINIKSKQTVLKDVLQSAVKYRINKGKVKICPWSQDIYIQDYANQLNSIITVKPIMSGGQSVYV